MKVMMVLPSLGRGSMLTGTPAHVLKVTKGLREIGVDVRIFECREGRSKDSRVDVTASLWTVWYKFFYELLVNRPDVIHAHTHEAALVSLFFSKLFRISLIYECHGVPRISSTKKIRSTILRKSESLVVAYCDAFVCQAKAMERRMNRIRNGIFRCLVLYPGVRVDEFCFSKHLNVKSGEKSVVYVGTSQTYQGLSLLAECQKYILSENVRFFIHLSDGTADFVKSSLGFDLSRTDIFDLRDSEQIPNILCNASLLVHSRPDVPDNWNVQSKLGLYLASARPIVTTLVGDYIDILSDYKGALLVKDDPVEIAAAIDEVLNNQNYEVAAMLEGKSVADKYFNVVENSKKLSEFYKMVTS